ncbi:MAG: hypothetical protein II835_06755 [Fibrobacter sp.]|nr:hypothetical protein [Fibrobacter sp.]
MSNFTYLYVLVSKPGDTYYEQTLVSAISLRHHMPDANIVLLVDNRTAATLVEKRAEIKKYVTSVKSVDLSDSLTNVQKSRWLKTIMPELIETDFLYIDSDTVITQPLTEIETIDIKLGAVLDKHSLLSQHCNRPLIEKNVRKMGFQASVNDKHFNGGLLLVRHNEDNRNFFRTWHSLWLESVKKGLSIDQVALAQTNYLTNGLIQELPGIWNCQVEYGVHLFAKAKILHMFVTGDLYNRRPHIFMDPKTFKEIEKNGITPEIMQVIMDPMSGFKKKVQVIGGSAVDYFNTPLSRIWCLLYCMSSKTKIIFGFFNRIADLLLTKLKKK